MASVSAPMASAEKASAAATYEVGAGAAASSGENPRTRAFDAIYERHAPFVWRSVCRLGVPSHAADDVMQEIFLVVHRRLRDFEERQQTVAWLYAIVIRVVRQFRRTTRRKSPAYAPGAVFVDPNTLIDGHRPSPLEMAEREEAIRTLYAVLDHMNEERREVFVLSELEQLSAPEIAEALSVNINTIYWRLRTARQEFEKILARQTKAPARSHR
jgi:RNA polymerase sigma-70 factor (ECF subfamily)